MAKIYLNPGQQFNLSGGPIRIGSSGTCVDSLVDWRGLAQYCAPGPVGETTGNDEVGSLVIEGDTYTIIFEESSGRFWYDDELHY